MTFPGKFRRRSFWQGAIVVLAAVVLVAVACFFVWRPPPRMCDIPVLMYHNVCGGDGPLTIWQVAEEEFSRQMDELDHAGYETVLPCDIERASRGLCHLPRKPVVITFDDGYAGVAEFAEPILAKHGFRAICYVIVDRLGETGQPRTSFDSGPLLTAEEAGAMHARGTVLLGSHSLTHVRNPAALAAEIRLSRYRLRERTGVKSRDYCYPFGLYGYDAMYAALRDSHYRTALICEDRMFRFGVDTNLLAIPRLSVYGGRHSVGFVGIAPDTGKVALTNGAMRIPLKVVARREADGRIWETDMQWVRAGKKVVFSLPAEALAAPCLLEARDKAGLFLYASAPLRQ